MIALKNSASPTDFPELDFVWIEYADKDFSRWVDLRQRILRGPLGLKFTTDDLYEERCDKHLIARLRDGSVIGGLILQTRNQPPAVAKMRQVVVDPTFQKKGIGCLLVQESEKFVRETKLHEIILHARVSVCEFYEKLGYETEGERFIEIGIPHLLMRKKLAPR